MEYWCVRDDPIDICGRGGRSVSVRGNPLDICGRGGRSVSVRGNLLRHLWEGWQIGV